jgi:REP element-mobilizing transposase RayT
MGQSLVQNYLHIVFATKHREKLIYPPYEDQLYAYLGMICKNQDCPVLAVGGYQDHIHILCRLSKNIALSDLIRELKTNSSKWMKARGDALQNFRWQNGFGAFSIDYRGVDPVIQYIKHQHQHHRKRDFRKELLDFFENYDLDYNEEYLWRD